MKFALLVLLCVTPYEYRIESHPDPVFLTPNGGAIGGTGGYYMPMTGGVVNTRTGSFMMRQGRHGFVDTETGHYTPAFGRRREDESGNSSKRAHKSFR